MSDCDRTMFCETGRLLHKMRIKGLIDDNIQLRNKILLENLINNDTPKLEIISSLKESKLMVKDTSNH